jgi:hypothetical protein
MGATKDRIMDHLEETQKRNWIEAHLAEGVLEDSDEWAECAELYDKKMEQGEIDEELYIDEASYFYEDDIVWSKENDFSEFYYEFKYQLDKLLSLPVPSDPTLIDIALKMRFSYAVTLMESCLGDMLKNVTLSDDFFRKNAINGIDELATQKFTLNEVLRKNSTDFIDEKIHYQLTEMLYHNIPKVNTYYAKILGVHNVHILNIPHDVNKKINKAMALRHHVAHRNGRDKDGKEIKITESLINEYIEAIKQYVGELFNWLDKVSSKVDQINAEKTQQEQEVGF